jgi:hypothetical protein
LAAWPPFPYTPDVVHFPYQERVRGDTALEFRYFDAVPANELDAYASMHGGVLHVASPDGWKRGFLTRLVFVLK